MKNTDTQDEAQKDSIEATPAEGDSPDAALIDDQACILYFGEPYAPTYFGKDYWGPASYLSKNYFGPAYFGKGYFG